MNRAELIRQIFSKKSCLCVGLDTDVTKIPACLQGNPDPVFAFNKIIIDATRNYAVAYKINTAFYEAMGTKGWDVMERTLGYIGSEHFTIADAKRGDIGNTSAQYAKAFFKTIPFDAITVNPYMGEDSVRPFLDYEGKWVIVLGLTSNSGAGDFEMLDVGGERLYEAVIRKASRWGTIENLMFVAGATQPQALTAIRELVPEHFLLIPGVGAQGGDLREIIQKTKIRDGGILVNASRSIIYASSKEDFGMKAAEAAQTLQKEMALLL
ncbi:MAG: orotidine-5'-phosphate decarboxylase [Chitinophagaceae bacterium]|nr:orotidine-5'-phosphate decarboxylase [Chitinophagaceae bacterium]